MYKVDLPVDNSADLAVNRRRAAEAARLARIFNTRNRVMGLDLPTLEQQVTERKARDEMARQREMAFDLLRVTQDKVLMHQQWQEEEMRAELNKNLVQYHQIHQRAEDSLDADLTFDQQGALELSESELGPASMKVFQGEDIGEDERRRSQMEQTERALRAQREERERRLQDKQHKELLVGQALVHQDLRSVHLDALEEECKRATRIALNNYNQAQAAERAELKRKERMRKEGEELSEVCHMMTSDILTECPEAAQREAGGRGGPRILTDRWRGMSGVQLSAIYRQREEQRAEKERQREVEKQRDVAWDFKCMLRTRGEEEEEQKRAELQKEKRLQMGQYNEQLAREQRQHQEYLKNQVYTNKPTVHYFTQFNSSSR
ncbi:RIB43A-like with coiled-coils protein 1 [Hypomesus transpacificus]|uniref:RIB43A-like with coiled-coils protein 1 n=1 Tax=Hypomesus transpacificus TaxID=137520 RepID=UPI001F072136|nr:RIB43A-like with coiled-coils protein 1 [Hypomesus transpacificus]